MRVEMFYVFYNEADLEAKACVCDIQLTLPSCIR